MSDRRTGLAGGVAARRNAGGAGGIITPEQALAGFANPGVATVAVLYVVAAGLREAGCLPWVARYLLGRPAGHVRARLRLTRRWPV